MKQTLKPDKLPLLAAHSFRSLLHGYLQKKKKKRESNEWISTSSGAPPLFPLLRTLILDSVF